MGKIVIASLLGLGLAVIAQRADAQQSTTATYEDWTVRCITSAGPPPQKLCDMEQVSHLQSKDQPVLSSWRSRTPKRGNR